MGIFSFIKRIKDKNNDEFDEKIGEYKNTIDYVDNSKDENIEINFKVEEKEIDEEPIEIIEEVKLTKEEVDELIYNEILRIIDLYDDFNEVKTAAMESARKIGKENLVEIPKFLNGKIHRPAKYINKYFEDSEWSIAVENSILMIVYSFNREAVPILERISQKNSKLNLKAINLLCKLASEGVETDEIVNWIMNNLVAFNDENKIIILGFMSQIKSNNQVIGLIQHFYKVFIKNGEIEYAFKTLKHLINAAERFTQGHLKFLKYIAMGKEIINLEEITMLEDGDPKTISFSKIDENLSIEAAITYYTLDKNDDDINSKLYYLSEYSLDNNLRKNLKTLLKE
jgi:hypothetical protein